MRSVRTFVREAVTALITDRVAATPLSVALATHVAAKEVAGERLLPGAGETPTGGDLGGAGGDARPDHRGAAALGAGRRGRGRRAAERRVWAAAVQERVDVRLRAAGFFDARGAGALLAATSPGPPTRCWTDLGASAG